MESPYRTAWRMAHEIRKYMTRVDGEWSLGGPDGGDVEADETYVGGKRPGGKRPDAIFGDLVASP